MCTDGQVAEVLRGFQKPMPAPDDQTTVIGSPPAQPRDIKGTLIEGMPICHRQYEKGHLIIQFKVIVPENALLSPDKTLC